MATRIAILGDGAWGTAIALLLHGAGHGVSLWSAREANGRLLQQRRENVHLLPGVPIPDGVLLTLDAAEAARGAALWVSAVPTAYLREVLGRVRAATTPGPPVV